MPDIKTHADYQTRAMWYAWLAPALAVLTLAAIIILHLTGAPTDKASIQATVSMLFIILLLASPFLFLILLSVIILIDNHRSKQHDTDRNNP